MKVRILTPQAVVFDDEAVEVVLPGTGGVISVMDSHQDIVCGLVHGEIILRRPALTSAGSLVESFPVAHGVAQVVDGTLLVMEEPA
jgi:F0F1-type ATP synthase epsilon subunit